MQPTLTGACIVENQNSRIRARITPDWDNVEGTPYPLGVCWVAPQQAYNFAIYSKHAEKVVLLLYAHDNLTQPILTCDFDYLRNKSGPIWHCRIPANRIAGP